MAEHTITFYADPNTPLALEWSEDGVFWEQVEAYDVRPVEGCDTAIVREATVDVESGYVRGRYLFGNPQQFDTTSNNVAVPEPLGVGLIVGAIALAALGRWSRGR